VQGIVLGGAVGEMLLEHGMADMVQIGIDAQYFASIFHVQRAEAAIDFVEHVVEDDCHLHELARVRTRDRAGSRLDALGDAHDQVANAFQVGDALQTREQLAGPSLADAGDGSGEALVDLAFDLVEFFLTIAHCEEGHAGGIGEQIANIEGGVARDEAGFESEPQQFILRIGACA